MRPVLSRSGRDALVSLRNAGTSGATKRASAIGREEAAFGEEPRLRRCPLAHRPLHRRQRIEGVVGQILQRAEVEIAAAVVFEGRECGVLAKDIGGGGKIECRAEAEALCHLADDPPVRLRLAGRIEEGALARDAALRIGHGAGFLAPGLRGQQHMRAGIDGVVAAARSRR